MRLSLVLLPALFLCPSCSCDAPSEPDGGMAADARPLDAGVPDAPRLDAGADASRDVDVHDGANFDATAADDASHDAPDVPTDAGPPCEVPIVWTADTTTEAAALADLATLSSTARPTWNDARGTFETIFEIDAPLACPDGAEVWDTLLPFVDAHPALLQIDRAEWLTPGSFPCHVVSSTNDYARMDRRDFGPGTVAHDFLSFAIRRTDDGIVLRAIIANYLPVVPDSVAEPMARCGGLSPERVRASVMRDTFPYSMFMRCIPTGGGSYTSGPLDVITLDPPRWAWTESADGTGVEMTSEQPGTLLIDRSYWTPALETSDVNCPDETGDERVYGFRLIFDTTTGAIISKQPGVGCIVC